MQNRFVVLLFSCGLLYSTQPFAQQQVDLDPVTVTSSISPIASSKTGRNIITIKGELFEKLPVNSVDDVLRFLPGIEVQARGPMGVQSDFVIRGGTFQQVLVILDGLRLNDPLTGHFSSYIPLAPKEIERIEVLKGASSAIYGSEAVGGVIHIITKSFAAKREKQKQVGGQIVAGEFGLVNGSAGFFNNNGKTAVSAGIQTNNADGQQQRGIKGFFNLHTVSASVSHHLNENWQVALRSGYDDRKFAAQNFYSKSVADTATEHVTSFWNTARVSYQKNKNKLSFHAGYKKAQDEFIFNSVTSANKNNSSIWQGLVQYEHKLNSNTSFTSGVQFVERQITSNNRGNHKESQVAGFAILHHTIADKLTLAPALRVDWNENRDLEFVPQINLSYRVDQFQLRGSAGKTIRDADFTERYNNYNRKNTPNLQSIGNPDLEAETSFSYEAGVDLFASSNLKISATYFQRKHEKLIDYVLTNYNQIKRKDNLVAGNTYGLATNIAKVTTTGVETDFQYSRTFNNKHNLVTNWGIVWLDSESSELAPSFYVSSHARFLSNFSVQYGTPKVRFSTSGIYKNRDPQPGSAFIPKISSDYFVINGKLEILFFQQHLGIFTQLDNIFDEKYSDLFGAQMPGRWFMLGAKLNF